MPESPAQSSKRPELYALMRKLMWDKFLHIEKYRLLDLVDATNDAVGNWKLVGAAYEEVGGNSDDLYYVYPKGNEILIMVTKPKHFGT